ncbi:DUF4331 family protein [Sphingomonas sp. ID1715]|uniref:DUF4331 family protein n=1 Tax=Sphingomonas sp. ID1715 TaxID=1656898 RepID=UPI0014878B6A|nr:DUF4331 family protein [Sphingomonas sp. ID1715]NNM76604.1 DUF4331 family protein [Sphingomonas sp. ID1715]
MVALRTWLGLGGALALIPAVLVSTDYATRAADHLDPPTRTDKDFDPIPDVPADIADVFAWYTPTSIIVALTFAGPQPNNMPPTYDRDVLYTINISNAGARTDPEIQIRCRFGFDGQSPGMQCTGIPGTNAPVVGPVQTVLQQGEVKVIGGIFEDPFFFDLLGFRETRSTGTLAIRNTRDFFRNQNDTSIVIEMPRSAVLNNNQPLDIWAETARFGGQK